MNKLFKHQNHLGLFKKLMFMDNMEKFSEFPSEASWLAHRAYYFSTFLELPPTADKFSDFVIFDFSNLDEQGTVLVLSGEGELLDSVTYERSLNEVIEQYEDKKIVFEHEGKPKIPRYELSEKNMRYLVENPHDLRFHELISSYSSLRDSALKNLNYLNTSTVETNQQFAHSVVHRVPAFYNDELGGYTMRSMPVKHEVSSDGVLVSIPRVAFGQIISEKNMISSYELLMGDGRDFNEAYENLADKIIETYGITFDKWKGFLSDG